MNYLSDREVKMIGELAARTYLHKKDRDRLVMEMTLIAGACVVFFIALVASIAR